MSAAGRPDITSLLEADLRHLAPLLRRRDHRHLTAAAIALTQRIRDGGDIREHLLDYQHRRTRALRRAQRPLRPDDQHPPPRASDRRS